MHQTHQFHIVAAALFEFVPAKSRGAHIVLFVDHRYDEYVLDPKQKCISNGTSILTKGVRITRRILQAKAQTDLPRLARIWFRKGSTTNHMVTTSCYHPQTKTTHS